MKIFTIVTDFVLWAAWFACAIWCAVAIGSVVWGYATGEIQRSERRREERAIRALISDTDHMVERV